MTPDPTDLAALPGWAAAELAALRAELTDTRAALIAADEARRVAERERDEARWALYVCEHGFRTRNFRGMDERLADQWADYCAHARGAPHMTPAFSWIVSPREAALFGEGEGYA